MIIRVGLLVLVRLRLLFILGLMFIVLFGRLWISLSVSGDPWYGPELELRWDLLSGEGGMGRIRSVCYGHFVIVLVDGGPVCA